MYAERSFWPDGYVPPAVRERQEEEARLKRRQEKLKVNKNREKEEGSVRESTDKGTLEVTISEHVSAAQRKQNKGGRKKTQQGIKDATKTEKQLEEQRRNEEKMREVAALQKKEELARKRAARTTAAGKNIGRKKRVRDRARENVGVKRTNLCWRKVRKFLCRQAMLNPSCPLQRKWV